jgi:hypothetical protein
MNAVTTAPHDAQPALPAQHLMPAQHLADPTVVDDTPREGVRTMSSPESEGRREERAAGPSGVDPDVLATAERERREARQRLQELYALVYRSIR